MKAFWWVHRFAGNFWYYYIERQRWSGYPPFSLSVALGLAYRHTVGFKAPMPEPAWGGDIKDFE